MIVVKSKSLVMPVLVMLLGVPLLIYLGVWQWQRKAEKEALIIRIEQRAIAPAKEIFLEEMIRLKTPVDDLDFTSIKLTGRFLYETEVRTFTTRAEGTGKFTGPGYDILTLFIPDSGGIIMVNRGFVPPEPKFTDIYKQGQVTDSITITGVFRKPERRSYIDVPDQPLRNEFAIRDPKAVIAAKLSSEMVSKYTPVIDSIYLDLRSPTPQSGLPQPGQTSLKIVNNHLQYAITWWGFALVFMVMFGVFLRQHIKQV